MALGGVVGKQRWEVRLGGDIIRRRSSLNTAVLVIGISHMNLILIKLFYHGEKAVTDRETDSWTTS